MTAAGLDFVSDGRFHLGIGTSGPQVMEGFHGVAFDAPIGRTREIVEICRKVWRRERVEYDGKHYQLPLPAERGQGWASRCSSSIIQCANGSRLLSRRWAPRTSS